MSELFVKATKERYTFPYRPSITVRIRPKGTGWYSVLARYKELV